MRLQVEALEARWVPSYTLSSLADFASGPQGGLVADSSGNLFGASGGTDGHGQLFEWVKATGTVSVLATFNGASGLDPKGSLAIDASGNLFGTTGDGGPGDAGTVFEWVKSTGALTVLAYFNGANGSGPNGGLVEDSSGNLFGTTQFGGANGDGALFEWVKSSGTLSVLTSFSGASGSDPNGGLVADSSGNLFGTTPYGGANAIGTVFEWVKSTDSLSILASFNNYGNAIGPNGGLVEDTSGNLFGTTQGGGSSSDGTVFEWVKSSGSLTTLASFTGSNGKRPMGNLVADSSGNLFGTTDFGGSNGIGTVFEWVKSTGSVSALASFNGSNGNNPWAGLVADARGNLFGSAPYLGNYLGTVFEWVKATSTVSVLATFNGASGLGPNGGLVADSSGNLFGTTAYGGAYGAGTVFEWVKSSGSISVLASFNGSDGQDPNGGLVEDTSGNLFGTTQVGGTNFDGTVFEWVKSSGSLTTLATFTGSNGDRPEGDLDADSSGDLFGTTQWGGNYGGGTIFEWVKSSGSISVLASFSNSNGYEPNGGLIADSSGNLFGTTLLGGANNGGTLFEWVKSTGTLSFLATFNGSNGVNPWGGLVADASGNLFGSTQGGGTNNYGTVFEWVKSSGTLSTLASFSRSNGRIPNGGLAADTGGNLFGTALLGGANDDGTVFEWVKSSGTLSTLTTFSGGNGYQPNGGLIHDMSGNLFGTAQSGGVNLGGMMFEVAKSTTWTGLSPLNHNWSNPGNWSDGVPTTGETAIFSAHPGGSSTAVVDTPASAVLSIFNDWGGTIQVNQPLTTTDSSHWDSGTISVAGGVTWTNSGTLTLNGGGNLSLSGTGTLSNPGTLSVSGGTTFSDSGEYTETGTLVVQPSATATLSGTFDNYDGAGTLTGGTYDIQGTFQFTSAAITTNAATVVLDGAGSRIIDQSNKNGLASFATNTAGAGFTIQNGRGFTTAGDFENDGSLTVGNNSSVLVITGNDTDTGTLSVLSGGTLALSGGGTASGTVSVAGTLLVDTNQTFTDSGSYSETGTLFVRSGATATLSGIFSNFANSTLTGGTYDILGTLQFANAVVVTDAATLMLDGSAAAVTDLAGTDALGPNLTTITSAGQLFLLEGASFTSPGSFTVAGKLNVGNASSAFTSGGSLTIASGATLALQSTASIATTGDFNVQSNVAIPNGATVSVGGNLNVASGTLLDVQDGSTLGVLGNVSNSGDLGIGAVTVSVGGSFTEAHGAALFIASTGAIATTGDFNLQGNLGIPSGAKLSIGGNLNVASATTLTIQTGATVSPAGNVTNQGTVKIASGVIVSVGGNYTEASGSTLTIANTGGISTTGDFNVQAGLTIPNGVTIGVGGNLNVASGTVLTVQPGASLSTTGDFNDNGSAVIAAGVTVNVGGNYTQAAAASLDLQLGGTATGQYAVLAVSGQANLNGTLKDTLVNGYVPQSGDTLPVLTYATRSGTFTTGPAGFTLNYDDADGILDLVKL